MSFIDKISDAFEWSLDNARIGSTWAIARAKEIPVLKETLAVLQAQRQVADMGAGSLGERAILQAGIGALNPFQADLDAANKIADTFSRGISTGVQQLGPASVIAPLPMLAITRPGQITDPDSWKEAWNRSRSISPGQALSLTFNPDDVLQGAGIDPNRRFDDVFAAQRRKFFYDTWPGRLESGSIDFALNVFADPVHGLAKGAKGAAVAARTLRGAGDVTKAVTAADELMKVGSVVGASRRTANMAERITSAIRATDGMSPSDMMMRPEFSSTGDSGALAYLFDRANKVYPDDAAARHDLKLTTWSAMMGHRPSLDKLEGMRSDLLDEIRTFSGPPMISSHAEEAASKGWSGALLRYNDEVSPELSKEADNLVSAIDRVIAARGSASIVAGSGLDRLTAAMAANSLDGITIQRGVGRNPLMVVTGKPGTRLPGHVSVKDANTGFGQLRETLAQAKYLDPNLRRDLLNRFVRASTVADRQGIVHAAEAAIVSSVGQKYGLSRKQVEHLLAEGNSRREAYRNVLKTRLYSAMPDAKTVTIVDPSTGTDYAIARPLLASQLEDNVHLVDPRLLDRAIRSITKNRISEQAIRRHWGGTTTAETVDTLSTVAFGALDKATALWKDGMLFRLAYPMRVQADSQLRLAAFMGAQAYLLEALPKIAKVGFKYGVTGIGRSGPLRNYFKPEFQQRAVNEILDGMNLPNDMREVAARRLLDEGGSLADLITEMADRGISKARATGNWGYVDPSDAGWADSYLRAVQRQIQNDPVAMRILRDERAGNLSMRSLKGAIRTDPQMREAWRELRNFYETPEDYLMEVAQHLKHYLPTDELRDLAARKRINEHEIRRIFGGPRTGLTPDIREDLAARQALRMRVHGENYAPGASGAWATYQGVREKMYTVLSTMPENVLARAPLFRHAFEDRLRDVVGKLGGDTISQGDLAAARVTALKLARRDVSEVLFDSAHASNLSHTLRHVAPFFAAWEDMMKKWGKLLYDNPQALRRIQQAWNAPNAAGIVVDGNGNPIDQQGDHWYTDPETDLPVKLDPVKDKELIGKGEYVILPLGPIGNIAGAKELRFRKSSFNLVFQGDPWWLPGVGPLVQVPTNEITKRVFPDLADSEIGQYLLPFGVSDRPVGDQILPAWARSARSAFGNTKDHSRTFALLMAQEWSLFRDGKRSAPPTGEEIDRKTRNWYILRAMTGFASPVAASPSAKLQFWKEEGDRYRRLYGKEWEERFLTDHPQFFDMTISLTTNESGIQATDRSWNALEDPKIRRLVSENPKWGWAILGPAAFIDPNAPGGKYSKDIEIALGTARYGFGNTDTFRGEKSPAEAMKDMNERRGWVEYSKLRTIINEQLAQRGIRSLSAKGAEDLKAVRDAYIAGQEQRNPDWFTDYRDGSLNRLPAFVQTMKAVQKEDPRIAERPGIKAFNDYMRLREVVRGELSGRERKSLDDPTNTDLKVVWDTFTAGLVRDSIEFEQMWNRVLETDSLRSDL